MKILTNIELYAVAGSWVLFILVFVTRGRGVRTSLIARDRGSLVGLLLQLAALGFVRGGRRAPGMGLLSSHLVVELVGAAVAFALIAASIWLAFRAVHMLGKQWSLAARLVLMAAAFGSYLCLFRYTGRTSLDQRSHSSSTSGDGHKIRRSVDVRGSGSAG